MAESYIERQRRLERERRLRETSNISSSYPFQQTIDNFIYDSLTSSSSSCDSSSSSDSSSCSSD